MSDYELYAGNIREFNRNYNVKVSNLNDHCFIER